jgi:hypothetical protein
MSGPHAAHLAALEVLQDCLASLYGVADAPKVSGFVLDEETQQALEQHGAIHARPGAREEVYVLDDGHSVDVAVFLDERAREAAADAVAGGDVTLSSERFHDFCVALEGVSHFLLMSHRAFSERPVTQLELELQAEVDKYVMARLSPWHHRVTLTQDGEEPRVTAAVRVPSDGPRPEDLEGALFDSFSLAPNLHHEQRERYVTASRLAHRYCRHLERTFLRERRGTALTRNLRTFYRLGQADRLAFIAR